MHLICGEALYDVFIEQRDLDSAIEIPLRAVAGGSPFNVAVGMARLGVATALATDLAPDVLGEHMVQMLATENVDRRFLRRTAPSTALALVATDRANVPRYSFVGLDQAIYAPDLSDPSTSISEITGLHLGSIAIVMPRSSAGLLELARRLADQALLSFDPNVRLTIEPNVARWQSAIEQHRLLAHVIKVSEEDICAVFGRLDPQRICESWLSERTVLVILTRGANGASIFSRDHGCIDIPALKTAVIDTIGAGDSFMAAFLAILAKWQVRSSRELRDVSARQIGLSGRFAAAAASLTCARRGPCLPALADIEAIVPFPVISAG